MIMAAVMVGGMVPPIAIAISTMVSKKKYTEAERKTGPANIVMGLSFITEGAIPFAAADPLHVIPSLMVGSGIAGALSMAFKCTLMAPHGGIFVFPVVGNVAMYLVALIVGSVVGARSTCCRFSRWSCAARHTQEGCRRISDNRKLQIIMTMKKGVRNELLFVWLVLYGQAIISLRTGLLFSPF